MIQFDSTISVGDVVAVIGMAGVVALYFLDTRYSPKGLHADTRALKKMLEDIDRRICQHIDDDNRRFDETRDDIVARFDNAGRDLGETITAMRTKVSDVEIFMRDTFVRRDSFQQALAANQTIVTGAINDLKVWMGRIENRLNRLLNHQEATDS